MKDTAGDRLFREPGLDWKPVSPKLVTERRLPVAAVAVVGVGLLVAALMLAINGRSYIGLLIPGVLIVVATGLNWFVFVPRVVASWRYAEREEDLLVSHGRLQRKLSVVPYGRMQVIEVSANPISRRLGIATVTLVTASASTDATIPGLPVAEAHELRDRLAAKGEALSAGL
ncbi:MAG: PH domain-containing protein [Nocardioidaceae bacterium]